MGGEREITNVADFRIIDESDDFIVVEKPAPLLVHPSTPDNPPTLIDGLRLLLAFEIANGAALSIINRLDRETSGIVLVTKNKAAARKFSLAIQRRQAHKEYLAIARGWPAQSEWEIDAPILRKGEVAESPIWVKQIVHPAGAPSQTRFRVEQTFERNGERLSLIRATPVTGRMHQIRVHLAHSSHPILGDKIYGPDETCYLDFIETGWTPDLQQRLILPRHALHSCLLEIAGHHWECPLPGDLESVTKPGN